MLKHETWSRLSILLFCLLLFTGSVRAFASASLLVEDPFGHFGGMNPTGHAAVYFDRICADTPTRLRACHPGEMGVVVSRYHKIAGYDWLAIPILPYLYAVEDVEEVPSYATPEMEEELREAYRKRHLRALQPDTADGTVPDGEWIQLVGAAYDRTIHGFTVATNPNQEERFIAEFNDRRNVSHFNGSGANMRVDKERRRRCGRSRSQHCIPDCRRSFVLET